MLAHIGLAATTFEDYAEGLVGMVSVEGGCTARLLGVVGDCNYQLSP